MCVSVSGRPSARMRGEGSTCRRRWSSVLRNHLLGLKRAIKEIHLHIVPRDAYITRYSPLYQNGVYNYSHKKTVITTITTTRQTTAAARRDSKHSTLYNWHHRSLYTAHLSSACHLLNLCRPDIPIHVIDSSRCYRSVSCLHEMSSNVIVYSCYSFCFSITLESCKKMELYSSVMPVWNLFTQLKCSMCSCIASNFNFHIKIMHELHALCVMFQYFYSW